MKIHAFHAYVKMGLTLLCSKLLSIVKLSFIVGSQGILLSASNLCLPLTGLFGGISGASLVWAILLGTRLLTGNYTLATLAFYIPGYCAALYLATNNRFVHIGLPLLCMALFLVHPTGYAAGFYTSYWLIPMIVAVWQCTALPARALGATFTAHAVGSVIWLYTMPMSAAAWLSLMPLVALERCTFAAGLVVSYYAITSIQGILCLLKKRFISVPA